MRIAHEPGAVGEGVWPPHVRISVDSIGIIYVIISDWLKAAPDAQLYCSRPGPSGRTLAGLQETVRPTWYREAYTGHRVRPIQDTGMPTGHRVRPIQDTGMPTGHRGTEAYNTNGGTLRNT